MKRVKLDSSGIITKHPQPSKPRPVRIAPVPMKQSSSPAITAEFVREVKDELVQELAALLVKMGISVGKKVVFGSQEDDETSRGPVILTKPILIDDSIVVTHVAVGTIEKGFDKLAETKVTQDDTVSSSISKLRSLKKGELTMGLGLDVGTSFIISARDKNGEVEYKEFRDAFYRIKPTTPIAAKMIEKGLAGKKFFKDSDGAFVVIGQDAIEKAVERHDSAQRPMVAGVLAPGEKEARRILKFIIREVTDAPLTPGEKIAYSVPAQPIDVQSASYDVGFHEDVLRQDLQELGFTPISVNEAEAICFSELEEDNYTGIALSFGAGMVNVCLMSNGEALVKFATTKSGDWIDRMVAVATREPDSVVQQQKEDGGFIIGESNTNPILAACSTYYERLITYTVQQLQVALSRSNELAKFKDPLPIVIAGGTSRAAGFIEKFREAVQAIGLPIPVKEVRPAKDQLRAVARGLMVAASL